MSKRVKQIHCKTARCEKHRILYDEVDILEKEIKMVQNRFKEAIFIVAFDNVTRPASKNIP